MKMVLFLVSFVFSLKPIVFIPGHGGTNIFATLVNSSQHPECPPEIMQTKFEFWPPKTTFIAKYPDCMGKLLRCVYNNFTKTVEHISGFNFEVEKFGDLTTLPFYNAFTEYLVNEKHYEISKNLFGLPYDWILYFGGKQNKNFFVKDVKNYIEDIYNLNGKEKVIIMGHSLGTHVIKMFLEFLNEDNQNDWISNHIDSFVFLAPAFTGCFNSFNMVVKGIFSTLQYNKEIEISSKQMPSLHTLFENYKVFENRTIFSNLPKEFNHHLNFINHNNFKGNLNRNLKNEQYNRQMSEENEGIKAKDVIEYMKENKLINEEGYQIFKEFVNESLKTAPIEPPKGVNSYVIYNSAISTPIGYDVLNNYSFVNGTGDAFCSDLGPIYACDNWENVKCHDFKKNKWQFSHAEMMYEREMHDIVWAFIDDNSNKENKIWLWVGIALGILAVVQLIVLVILAIRKRKENNIDVFNSNSFISLVDRLDESSKKYTI